MDFFSSANVSVFPSTYRTQGTGKFTSEFNFTNIINSLVDKSSFQSGDDGFVLDFDKSNYNTLKVIIHGYYFEIKYFTPDKQHQVLEIRVADDAEYLSQFTNGKTTLDDVSKSIFEGLAFGENPTSTHAEGYSYYHVHVCDASGNIINKARLVSDSLMYVDNNENDINRTLNASQTLTRELNSKHYKLKVGKGLQGTGVNGTLTNNQFEENEIRIKDDEQAKLDSLENDIGNSNGVNGNRLFYFEKDSGKAYNSTANAGFKAGEKTIGGKKYVCSQSMYVSGGVISDGVTIYAGKNIDPPSSGVKLGDIYFKYQ